MDVRLPCGCIALEDEVGERMEIPIFVSRDKD
jgi:hypothetical protein